MTSRPAKTESAQELRTRAEEKSRSIEPTTQVTYSPEETTQLLHELRVHQIELEMQNTELRRIQRSLEVSEASYFDLYEMAPVGYLTVSERGVVQKANLAAASIFDSARENLLNKPITKLIFREDQTVFYLQRNKISAENEVRAWDMRLARADGSPFWAHLQATPVLNGEYLVTFSDITERKKAEEALQHERNLSMDILNAQPAGIYRIRVFATETWEKDAWRSSKSSPHVVELASEPFCKILSTTKEVFENNPGMIIDLIYPDDREGFAKKNEAAAVLLEKFIWEGRLFIDGVITWVNFESLPRPLENGDILWTGTLIDITDRKKAEEEKLVLEQQLQQAQKLESLGVLAGGIAHDFNNILAVIIGHCGLAKLRPDSVEENILQIESAAERAAGLCRQMLAYAGKSQLVKTRVDLGMLIDDTVAMLKATLPQNVAMKVGNSTTISDTLGDASQLRQVVMNLVINAAEAIGEKQGEVIVALTNTTITAVQAIKDHLGSAITPGPYICLEVIDSGCGLPEETAQRIFEPFYSTKFTGRGLGMSAVLGIIRSHGGALQLISQLGNGTIFKVYLPVLVSEESADESARQPPPAAAWRGSGTILLAEDEEQVRNIAKNMLTELGFTVIVAANGKEALDLYQSNCAEITLVLSDVGMPLMDGYELFRELRNLNPALPIIISSGFGDAAVIAHIDKNSLAGIVSKPYKFEQLREVLQGVLKGMETNQT